MPWQMAPPLIIIGGCFCATGLLLQVSDWIFLGRVRLLVFVLFVNSILIFSNLNRTAELELTNLHLAWICEMRL